VTGRHQNSQARTPALQSDFGSRASTHGIVRLLGEIWAEAGIQCGVLWVALDFKIVLEGVGGIDVGAGDGGLKVFSVCLHEKGFKSLALIYVAII